MARTRKSIQPLNLHKYDVLIEDRGPRSDYFKVSQFDGYFYGGRNAFLVAGAGVLQPNSKILVEVLNTDGNVVYSAPVTDFVEGNSRLVQVEVYSDTAIGSGKLVLLGCATSYLDGRPIPDEWKDKYNVRWVSDVTISPLVQNKTPIRFVKNPSVTVEEKFYTSPSSSTFTERVTVPVDVQLTPKYYNVSQVGYQIRLDGPGNTQFSSDYTEGTITGSIFISYDSTLETASISLPLTKIYNTRLADSQGSLIRTNKNTLLSKIFLSSSGLYTQEVVPFGEVTITGSVDLQYSKLETFNTASSISYAKLRAVDTRTLSGEINKVRVFYKVSNEPGDFVALADVNVGVQELLAVDSSSRVALTGKFNDVVINDYWYFATMSLIRNETSPTIPTYYLSSSLVGNKISEDDCCNDLLDAINTTPPIVGGTFLDDKTYFIGTRTENSLELFPRSEYTLKFDALVSKVSASISLDQSDYSLEVYLVEQENSTTTLLEKSKRGQLLGTLTPAGGFGKQNFENTQFNFVPRINLSGLFGLRFVVYGGNWSIANVSVKPAEEAFFSPDEIEFLVPNINYGNKLLTYKLQYVDINNNSTGVETLSIPTYFTGSETIPIILIESSSYATTASYFEYQNPGNNRIITSVTSGSLTGEPNLQFDGSTLNVTGSLVVSGSSTLRNIGPAQFSGSVNISGSTTITGSLSVSGLLSATSQSVQYVTSSQLNIGTNLITVNTQNPAPRFGGLAVIDSGSSPQRSGSLLFDSQNDQWIFVHQNQTSPTSSVLLMGPQTYNNIGNETNLTNNYLLKSVNAEHVGDSIIYDNGTNVGIGTASPAEKLEVNGSVKGGGGETYLYNFKNVTGRSSDSLLHVAGGIGLNGTVYLNYNGGTVSVGQATATIFNVNSGGFYVNTSNNVGIGTTSPISKLTVTKAGVSIPVTDDASNNAHLTLAGSNAFVRLQLGTQNVSPYGGWIQASYDNGGGANGVEPLLLNPIGGNVGIGTTNPGSLLHVQGAISGSSVTVTGTVTSTQATGTAPLTVASTTVVTNLNADLLDGNHASAFYLATNPSGYTTNTGTVTSVGGTGTVSGLTLSGTVTTTGNLTLGGTLSVAASNFSSQTANTFLAAPNGSAGTPTFRAIAAADVPTLNQNTTGTASNITAYTINQNLGTANSPSFAGLTVDTTTLYVDAANDRVGIGTTSPLGPLQVGPASGTPAGWIYFNNNVGPSNASPSAITSIAMGWNASNGGGEAIIAYGSGSVGSTGGGSSRRLSLAEWNGTSLTEVLTIQNNKVGIGTTSPSYKLDITGTGRFTSTVTANSFALDGGFSISNAGSYGQTSIWLGMSGHGIYTTSTTYMDLDSNNSSYEIRGFNNDTFAKFENTGTANTARQITVLTNDGKFGIGTGTPQGILNVYSGSNGALGGHIIISNNGNAVANETAIIFGDGTAAFHRAAITTITENSPYYGAIAFKTGIGTYSALTEKMRITGAGNVGIGTTNPAEKLHIDAGSSLVARLVSSGFSGIEYHNTNGTWAVYIGTENGSSGARYNSAGSQHTWYNNSVGTMRLNTTGLGINTVTPTVALQVHGSGSVNSYRGVIRILNASSDQWGGLAFPDGVATDSTANNYYFIGRGAAIANRNFSFHIPRQTDYGSGAEPKFLFASTGADTLMTLEANTGTMYVKGNVGIGTSSPGYALDVIGRLRFRSNGSNGAGVWHTDNSGTTNVFVGLEGVNSTDAWGVYSNSAWRFQLTNTNGHVLLNGKTAFESTDTWLRINQSAGFSSGVWFGSTPNIALGGTDSYMSLGSNGGTTTSRIYFRAGNYNGTNVMNFDGTTGNAYFAGTVSIASLAAGSVNVNSQLTLTTPASNTIVGNINSIWGMLKVAGKKLYYDEDFSDGSNSIAIYNNNGGSAVTHTRKNSAFADSGVSPVPNKSGYVIEIMHAPGTSLGISPGYGGWYFGTNTSPGSRRLLVIFKMKIPSGRSVEYASNSIGTNGTSTWLTSNSGTGQYQDYALLVHTGTASFSSTHFYYISGGSSTTFYTYLASATVYDVTDLSADTVRSLAVGYDATPPTQGVIVSGRVGIGTTSPSKALHVVGDILGEGTNGYGLNASSGKYYFFDNFTGNNFIGLSAANSVALAAGGSVTLTVTSGLLEVTGNVKATGNLSVDGTLGFRRGSGDYGTYIKANGYPGQGYANSDGTKYWVELGGAGGVHVVLNTDGGAGSVENAYDHFTVWQGSNSGDRLFYVTNKGNTTVAGGLGVGTGASTTAGEIRATNEITAYYSDARLKNFHGRINNSLTKVTNLNGYYFTENEVAKSLGYNNDKIQIGLSAQEVQAVLPEAVVPAPIDDMYLTVKYEKLVPLLIEAIKEQQLLIDQLTERVDKLIHIV